MQVGSYPTWGFWPGAKKIKNPRWRKRVSGRQWAPRWEQLPDQKMWRHLLPIRVLHQTIFGLGFVHSAIVLFSLPCVTVFGLFIKWKSRNSQLSQSSDFWILIPPFLLLVLGFLPEFQFLFLTFKIYLLGTTTFILDKL